MAKKEKQPFIIKRTVWEYYCVEAFSGREALSSNFNDPFRVDVKSERIVEDPEYIE